MIDDFRRVVEQAAIGTLIVDDQRVLYASEAAAAIFGRSAEEMTALTGDDFIHPDDLRTTPTRSRERTGEGPSSGSYWERAVRPDGSIREIETFSKRGELDGHQVSIVSIIDVTERNRAGRALNQMSEAIGSKIGQEFFSSLVLTLGRVLGVDYAFIAEMSEEAHQLRMIAVAADGTLGEPMSYSMIDTPCETVIDSSLCWFPSGVQPLYPRDELLVEMGVNSYAGIPLYNSAGCPIGLLTIMNRGELPRDREAEAALEVFSVRAAAELERRQAERDLLAAKSYLDNLLETAPVLVVELDAAGTVTRVNDAVELVTGIGRGDLLGREPRALFCGVDMSGGMPKLFENVIVRAPGRERLVAWRSADVRGTNGEVTGMLVVGADVTEQRRLQRDVARSAAEWKQTFDSVRTPILVTERNGTIVRANRAACELAVVDDDEIIGLPIPWFEDEPWQTAQQLVHHIADGRAATSAEAKDAQGRTWDLTIADFSSVEDASERFILVFWDLTGVVELRESLARSARMSAMGAIVAGVAHEVRNPLFGISATLDAYAGELSQPGYSECASALRQEVSRLSRVMQELLEYGKPAKLDIARGELAEVIDEVLASRTSRDASVRFECRVPQALPPLLMDRARMRQVFENLVDNAVQHSPDGGVVRVSAALVEQAGREWIECGVADAGPGFTAEDLTHAFEPFFTRRDGGTGLGLSIVQRIVEEHSGNVWAANVPGGGAVITLTLPTAGAER